MKIIHAALIIGQILFALVAISQTTVKKPSNFVFDPNDVFCIVMPLVAVVAFVVSIILFKKLLANAVTKPTLQEKLMFYQGASIQRFAFLEGASMFGIVCFLITGNYFFLAVVAPIIIYFLILRPTRERLENDLELSYQDKMGLDGESFDQFIS